MASPKQICALKYMIFNAKDGNDLCKRVLAYLIDQSVGLTRSVCLTLIADREGYSGKEIDAAAHGVGAMKSSNCTTHLGALNDLVGSRLQFDVHYGDFDPSREGDPLNTAGMFPGHHIDQVSDPELLRTDMPMRYTFWLCRGMYSRKATLVVAGKEDLDLIDLDRPGLYPFLEARAAS